jgi:hypothetical protein
MLKHCHLKVSTMIFDLLLVAPVSSFVAKLGRLSDLSYENGTDAYEIPCPSNPTLFHHCSPFHDLQCH